MYYVCTAGGGLQKENRKSRGKMKMIVIDFKNNIRYS